MSLYVPVCSDVCAYVCVKAIGFTQVSSLRSHPPCILKQGVSCGLGLAKQAKLAGQ